MDKENKRVSPREWMETWSKGSVPSDMKLMNRRVHLVRDSSRILYVLAQKLKIGVVDMRPLEKR